MVIVQLSNFLSHGRAAAHFSEFTCSLLSADFYPFLSGMMSCLGRWRTRQTSTGNVFPCSQLCPPHLRPRIADRDRALKIRAFSPSTTASCAVSVGRASAQPAASFRFQLAVDTLVVRLTVPPIRSVRDLHPQVKAPSRTHTKKELGFPSSKAYLTILPFIRPSLWRSSRLCSCTQPFSDVRPVHLQGGHTASRGATLSARFPL